MTVSGRSVILVVCLLLAFCVAYVGRRGSAWETPQGTPSVVTPFSNFRSCLTARDASDASPPCSPCASPTADRPCDVAIDAATHLNVGSIPSMDTKGISMLDLLRTYRNASVGTIMDSSKNPAVCVLSLFHTRDICDAEKESFEGCVQRVGLVNIEKVLPDICVQRAFWEGLRRRYEAAAESAKLPPSVANESVWQPLPRGYIPASTVTATYLLKKTPFVEPADRTYAQLGEPLVCPNSNITVYPFGFGIPASVIVNQVPRTKAFDFMPLMPGKHMGDRNYKTGISQEGVFRELYGASYFAFTNNRGGWDCMRHYEAMASGTVLFFPELPMMPKYTLTHLPRDLLKKALELPGVRHMGVVKNPKLIGPTHQYYERAHSHHIHFKKRGNMINAQFDAGAYWSIADEMLAFTKKHLTCGAMVASLLRTMGVEDAKQVLLVTRFAYDYLHLSTQTGFDELGIDLTIVGEDSRPWMYKLQGKHTNFRSLDQMTEVDRGEAMQRLPPMYGHGFTFLARNVNRDRHEYITNTSSDALKKRIEWGHFDAVIYTYIHSGMVGRDPYLAEASKYYGVGKPKPLAFIDHDDANFIGPHEYKKLASLGFVFAREIQEQRSCV